MDDVAIHLSSWLIHDRNYPDFVSGTTVAFAVRFTEFVLPLRIAPPANGIAPRFVSVPDQDGAGYEVAGRVIHAAETWWAIDVGIHAYTDDGPERVRIDDVIRGKLSFDVDSLAYADTFASEPDAPALIYDWSIRRIERQMAPLVELQNGLVGRDPSHSAWKPVARTHALRDDYGLAEYLLHCTPLGPPRKCAARDNRP